MNYEILEGGPLTIIFKYLDLVTLLNVRFTCKSFYKQFLFYMKLFDVSGELDIYTKSSYGNFKDMDKVINWVLERKKNKKISNILIKTTVCYGLLTSFREYIKPKLEIKLEICKMVGFFSDFLNMLEENLRILSRTPYFEKEIAETLILLRDEYIRMRNLAFTKFYSKLVIEGCTKNFQDYLKGKTPYLYYDEDYIKRNLSERKKKLSERKRNLVIYKRNKRSLKILVGTGFFLIVLIIVFCVIMIIIVLLK